MQVLMATFATIAAATICAIGLAIPWWVKGKTPVAIGDIPFRKVIWVEYHRGLWEECIEGRACIEITNAPDWLKTVRVMEIVGSSFAGAAGLLGLCELFVKEKSIIAFVAGQLAFAAVMISGTTVFAAKKNNNFGSNSKFHSGFALCIISAIVSFLGAVAFLFGWGKYCVDRTQISHRQHRLDPFETTHYLASLRQTIPSRSQDSNTTGMERNRSP